MQKLGQSRQAGAKRALAKVAGALSQVWVRMATTGVVMGGRRREEQRSGQVDGYCAGSIREGRVEGGNEAWV